MNESYSWPVCGASCAVEVRAENDRIVRELTIVRPDHGRQHVLLTAGRHSAEGECVMVTAFPRHVRKHVRSLLPKVERAEFDAIHAGTRLPGPGQFERWTDLAASFKPEPPRTT